MQTISVFFVPSLLWKKSRGLFQLRILNRFRL